MKKLKLSRTNKMIGGVCGGIAEYFGFDPSIVRIIVVLLFFLMRGSPLLLYIIFWAVIPKDDDF